MFTVAIEHNGRFCGLGADLNYLQATTAFVDYCNPKTWSTVCIDEMLKQLGYKRDEELHVYWQKPGKDAVDGLLCIQSDADIVQMLKAVSAGHKTLCLIVDHTNFIKRIRDDVNVDHMIPVRFHSQGYFRRDGCSVDYVGEEVVYEVEISRDDLCYKELMLYAHDVYDVELGRMNARISLQLYWLVPGKTLSDGLMFVGDNDAIKRIELGIGYGEKAEIYVEEVLRDEADEVLIRLNRIYNF